MFPSKHQQVVNTVIVALKQHFLTSWNDVLRGFLHLQQALKDKKQPEGRAEFPCFVLHEPGGGADFNSDGSERQTGGLTGGLGDVELNVPAQACLTAISVSMS